MNDYSTEPEVIRDATKAPEVVSVPTYSYFPHKTYYHQEPVPDASPSFTSSSSSASYKQEPHAIERVVPASELENCKQKFCWILLSMVLCVGIGIGIGVGYGALSTTHCPASASSTTSATASMTSVAAMSATATSTTSGASATPTPDPDCAFSGQTLNSNLTGKAYTKLCDSDVPSQVQRVNLADTFVAWTFDECISVCDAANHFNNTMSMNTVVYSYLGASQSGPVSPGSCFCLNAASSFSGFSLKGINVAKMVS